MCNEYGLFIKDKINFHHRHNEFEGDFSLEKFKRYVKLETIEIDHWYVQSPTHFAQYITNTFHSIELVSQLMDLQEAVFKLERIIIEPRNVNDCKAGALIPLVLESYAIYSLLNLFLTKMVESTLIVS